MKRIISILTATRAEYGLLKPLIYKLRSRQQFDIRIVVTGMHLSPEFGLTYREIEEDKNPIDKKIEVLVSSDSPVGISKSMGLAIMGFADYFDDLKPDLLIVLGDRYETLAVCCAAMNARIPIAHLHGGELTEGVLDDAIRHSITKMSYLHFTSTSEYRNRVIQMGESPDRVFNVGAIGLEAVKDLNYMTKEELEESIGFKLGEKFAVLTFHPVTLENNTAKEQFENILEALGAFKNIKIIITKSNADTGGREINALIDSYYKNNKNKCIAVHSLGQRRYLSALKFCTFVIGNSSSGIIEAPAFMKPVINIGDRQKGRTQARSVINCEPTKEEILAAIKQALSVDFTETLEDMVNPYGDGYVSEYIANEIEEMFSKKNNIKMKKEFYNL